MNKIMNMKGLLFTVLLVVGVIFSATDTDAETAIDAVISEINALSVDCHSNIKAGNRPRLLEAVTICERLKFKNDEARGNQDGPPPYSQAQKNYLIKVAVWLRHRYNLLKRYLKALLPPNEIFVSQGGSFSVNEPVPAPAPAPRQEPKQFVLYFDFDRDNLDDIGGTILSKVVDDLDLSVPKPRFVEEGYSEEEKALPLIEFAALPKRKLIELPPREPSYSIAITGHTDAVGPQEYNERLSLQRAKAVADRLVSLGVDRDRIETRAFGETELAVPTADGTSEPINRRVEITVSPE